MIYPPTYSITIIRRSTFRFSVQVFASKGGQEVDLSSNNIIAQLWNRARTQKYAAFNVDTTYISIGLLTLSLTADETINLPKAGVYDVKVISTDGDEYYLLLAGGFSLQEGYTDG